MVGLNLMRKVSVIIIGIIKITKMEEEIIIEVYYYIDEDGKKVIDEDEMRAEFEGKLATLIMYLENEPED
jgi:hypothetical protein